MTSQPVPSEASDRAALVGWRWRRLLTYAVVGWLMWENRGAIHEASPETVWLVNLTDKLALGAIGLTYLGTAARGDFLNLIKALAEMGAKVIPQPGGMFGWNGTFGVEPMQSAAGVETNPDPNK